MDNNKSTGNVISSYRKRRQQSNTIFVYGAAGLLVLAGIVLLIFWLTGPSKPLNAIFATDTPTPTLTFTPTITPSPTETSTVTPTPTETSSPTPSAPFKYTVKEGESLATIATTFNLGDNGILLLLQLNPLIDPLTQVIFVGQEIDVPNPGMELFTSTPVPANLARGTKVPYIVQPGDSLAKIASLFNSTVDAIVKENTLLDANAIQVGQVLQIPVNLVTPTATRPPTSTPRTPTTPLASTTPKPSSTPLATPTK
ncbi:MAG: LysM peptidoglycan-binding domain-containing protein [Chloroflexi bacterium]|nr:LysM peptidoglycan-binding domain-containing protein [Chloroflexota bacterium]MBI2758052.1 LysM peptidoglycan-binding domain-containing protein [Chloroflexota bacterium]